MGGKGKRFLVYSIFPIEKADQENGDQQMLPKTLMINPA
jgi:hypothetical protein